MITTTSQAIANWLNKRTGTWQRLQSLSRRQSDKHNEPVEEVMEIVQGSRELARDLSLARSVLPNSKIRSYLEALSIQLHDAIYKKPLAFGHTLKRMYRDEVPAVMRELRGVTLIAAALFIGSGIAGWLLVDTYPETVSLIASEGMLETVHSGELWTDDLYGIAPHSLSFGIALNNIMVSLFAFALGAFYGLGTIYIISMNGFMLGAIFSYTYRYDLAGRLFEFVVAHGVVELSVIVLAGAAGVRIGEALVRPGDCSRIESFRHAVSNAAKLLYVVVPFLVGAGVIEGYISPDHSYPLYARVTIGLGYGVLLWVVLTGDLWRFGKSIPRTIGDG